MFGGRYAKIDLQILVGGETASFGDLLLRDIDARNDAAATGKFAREISCAGAEVEDAVSGMGDAEADKSVVKTGWIAGTIAGVVRGGIAPIESAAVIDGFHESRLLGRARSSGGLRIASSGFGDVAPFGFGDLGEQAACQNRTRLFGDDVSNGGEFIAMFDEEP